MTPAIRQHLPRDPRPGSQEWEILNRNLGVELDRHERLVTLAARLPRALTDSRLRIRDLEMRLGMSPSFPPPTAGDR